MRLNYMKIAFRGTALAVAALFLLLLIPETRAQSGRSGNLSSQNNRIESEDLESALQSQFDEKKLPASSMMLSDDEKKRIERALQGETSQNILEKLTEQAFNPLNMRQESLKEPVHMGAMIYVDKENWTVWLNDETISSNPVKRQDKAPPFGVGNIGPDGIEIIWSDRHSGQSVDRSFILRPNQSLVPQTETAIEGQTHNRSQSEQSP